MLLYLSHIGEWTKPPKGTTQAQLVACYRHVRKLDLNGRKVAWWDDGVKHVPPARKVRS
jgi:hypothetical protein